ncbi:uncharacterized protein DEA37_0010249 [Paragonimus westermani]|uniref:Uncharacterized protein n=1 Tax=Paragonimus westermani TaxID=34504 RepID=A0A5J4NGW8_9TREM|nr:uncharacterized protein DEA37_0010249 [Paragonimus westermani]
MSTSVLQLEYPSSDGHSLLSSFIMLLQDRRMSKEAIHAASLLSNSSLKERMSFQSIFTFAEALSSQVPISGPSRIFTPSHSLSRVGCKTEFKSPQSLSPPLFFKPGHGDFREEDPCPSRQHLPVPSSMINASSHDGSSSGGVHQHSMSDSLIHSSPRRSGSHATSALHSHHHITHSAVAEFTGPRSLGLSPPPTPPHSAGPETSPGSVHPPPLPPRKSTSGKSGPSSSVAVPPQPAVIGVTATHSLHSKPPHGPLPSESIPDEPPPPLPPKMPTRIVTNRSGMTGSSPQPTLGQTFAFDSEALYSAPMTNCPPPLPPRRAGPTPMTHNIRSLAPELTTTTIPPA